MANLKRRRSPKGGCFVGRKFYPGGQFLPAGDMVSFDECAITAELALVTLHDDVYCRAMTAILHGSKAIRHRKVLQARRLRAVAHLVDAAESCGDRRTRNRLYELHQKTLQGVLALAGC